MTRAWQLDHPAPGLAVAQPVGGFKYTSDAFWLAGFALERPATTVLDLGTGSGIVAWLLASSGLEATGVDDHPEWPEGWARSSGPRPVRWVAGSVATLALGERFDLVTCNPPYWPQGAGPEARDPLTRAGRVERTAQLRDFVAAGLRHLAPGGTFALVLPAVRLRDLVAAPILEVVGCRDRALVRLGEGAPTGEQVATEDRVRGWYHRFGARPPERGVAGG